jgi:ribosomal protein S18 acetylase RimI-like enzyme
MIQPMNLPPITSALLERLERVPFTRVWDSLKRAEQRPDNPFGVTLLEADGLYASIVSSLPHAPWYNAITGLTEENLVRLEEILRRFEGQGIKPRLTLGATQLTPKLGQALFDHSLVACGVGSTLYAVPTALERDPSSSLTVRELAQGEDTETFDALAVEAYGFTHPVEAALAAVQNEQPNLRRYLALEDGRSIAAGAMLVSDGIAYLAGAATIPSARGRGAQSALIRQRLSDAAQCSKLVVVTTAFASQSQQNLERFGFRLAQVKTLWTTR